MSPVVGIDGGGTRTRALVADDDGKPLGRGEGPAGIVTTADAGAAAEAVRSAVERAVADSGLEPPLDALWAGLAGTGSEARRRAALRALEGLELARRVAVGTDVEAAYRDAFGAGVGVLLIGGTGSIALGRTPGGEWIRVGGWGALLGDEGSGYWIGLRGLRAVLAAHDGRGPATDLRGSIMEALGVPEPEGLVDAVAAASKAEVSRLATVVVEAAGDGDPVAREITADAVAALAEHVRAAADRMEATEPLPVALAGGLLAPDRPLTGRLRDALSSEGFRVRAEEVRPERGAVELARQLHRG